VYHIASSALYRNSQFFAITTKALLINLLLHSLKPPKRAINHNTRLPPIQHHFADALVMTKKKKNTIYDPPSITTKTLPAAQSSQCCIETLANSRESLRGCHYNLRSSRQCTATNEPTLPPALVRSWLRMATRRWRFSPSTQACGVASGDWGMKRSEMCLAASAIGSAFQTWAWSEIWLVDRDPLY